MSKIYIVNKDYTRSIQDDIRSIVTGANNTLLRECEAATIMEMIGYLNTRYDCTNLFPALANWNARFTYRPGDYVHHLGTNYRAVDPGDIEDAVNYQKDPADESTFWSSVTFPSIRTWDNSTTYEEGQYVERNGVFFRCRVEHSNQDPSIAENIYDETGETGYWTEDDPRDPKLVEICCRISLYKVHARIMPNQMPELRKEEHDLAVQWLKDVSEGKISPMLPKLPETEGNRDAVQYGSISKRTYNF